MFLLSLRQVSQSLWIATLVVLLSSCASTRVTELAPVQSPNDDFSYRLLTLENELQVLLISDPDSRKAAASLDVGVGSADNPPGRGGLAHFLEHMLFLGTDKYPDAAEYEEYITEHGGSRNAYTSLEHTNYFFDVNAEYLPEALDRFAQFFISPRFDTEYVDREKNAVEAEYQMGLKSDSRRGLDVLQEVMNQEHPFSQFTVGSLETLADRPGSTVRDELLRFYDKYYSANIMRLVVLGNQSLDELETLVVPMFTPVPNKSVALEPITQPLFAEDEMPRLVKVKPQATSRELQVSFPIADYRDLYEVKPETYVSNLLGHEGEGSLLSRLKAEGLAEGLSAGTGLSWRGGGLLMVSVSLTEKGVERYDRVLQLLFNYTHMLREQGPQKRLYEESSSLAELGFRFREQVEPAHYVRGLASVMHYYRPADILRGSYMMERYDEVMLSELLDQLIPENALIILVDQSLATDRESQHYRVPYGVEVISDEHLATWVDEVAPEVFHLPTPNEFIAEDVSLVELPEDNPDVPAVALQLPRQKIWYQQDADFRLPRGAIYINFRSGEVGQSAAQTAAAVLYTALLEDEVNEFSYPAYLAGLNFSVYKHAQGVSLRINGYDDKQLLLLGRLLDMMADPALEQARFDSIRDELVRQLENSVARRPSSQVMDDVREALSHGEWGEAALIRELSQLDRDSLRAWADKFWHTAAADVLIYGNYERKMVASVADLVANTLPDTAPVAPPPLKVLKLPAGQSLQYSVDVPHDDAVVAWYLQGEGNDWSDRAATALSAQIMKSGFFQQLRTEQQLGYVVHALSWPQLDVPGLVMLIQSPVADAGAVSSAMQAFMGQLESSIDEEQFERHRAALVQEILRPDKNMGERAEFYWQSIARKQYQFDGRETLAVAVESLDRDSWLQYYRRVFLGQRHSLQVIAPGKWKQMPGGADQVYHSAEAIKAEHEAYIIE